MANNSIATATVNINANAQSIPKTIQNAVNQAQRQLNSKPLNLSVNTTGLNRSLGSINKLPLGKIARDADHFSNSMSAATQRVVAFGAAVGSIYAMQSAIAAMVKTTIDVEKQFKEIEVLVSTSTKSFKEFEKGIFDAARSTATSFDQAAKAAQEFSRQGLGLEKTLERTEDALILAKLGGFELEKAVESLTATMNTFGKEVFNTREIVDKFARVDAKFAVSTKDLADGLSRVGNSAQEAGASFNETIAAITALQQRTARGGSVIGNALKSIFTRLQRSDTLDAIEGLGVAVKDVEGNTRPALKILADLAQRFKTVGDAQKKQLAEQIAGVYQINQFLALINDLGSGYSVVAAAANEAANAQGESVKRIKELTKTTDALIKQSLVNLTQFSSAVGNITFDKFLKNILNATTASGGFVQKLTETLGKIDTDQETTGSKWAEAILKGFANVLSGPGIALIAKIVGNLGKGVATNLGGIGLNILGINKSLKEQKLLQDGIDLAIKNSNADYQRRIQLATTVEQKERIILDLLNQQKFLNSRIDPAVAGLYSKGVRVTSTGDFKTKTKSSGFIPAVAQESRAIRTSRDYSGNRNAKPVVVPNFTMGGVKQPVVMNSAEKLVPTRKIIPNYAGPDKMSILNPRQQKVMGFGGGFVPNYARVFRGWSPSRLNLSGLYGNRNDFEIKGGKESLSMLNKHYKDGLFSGLTGAGNIPGITYSTSLDKKIAEGFAASPSHLSSANVRILSEKGNERLKQKFKNKKDFSRTYNDFLIHIASKKPFGVHREKGFYEDEKEVRVVDPNMLLKFGQASSGYIPNYALGAGSKIKHIPLNERREIFKKLREEMGGVKSLALGGGKNLFGDGEELSFVPGAVRINDRDYMVSYRAASTLERLVYPDSKYKKDRRYDSRKNLSNALLNRSHEDDAMFNTIGTSTSRYTRARFRGLIDRPDRKFVGTYLTPIDQIKKRFEDGKIGFPVGLPARKSKKYDNFGNYEGEREISQINGGNLVRTKRFGNASSGYIPNYAKQIKLSSGTIIDSSKKYLYGDEGLIGSNKSEANYFGYEPLSFQDLKELQKKKNIPNLKVYDPSLMLKTRMDEGLFKNNLLNKLFVTGARDFKFDKLQETRLARFSQKSDSLDNLFGGLKFNKENLPAIIKNIEGKIGSEFFVKGVKGYGGNATITADMLAALFNKDYFKKIFTLDNGKFSEFGQQLTKIKRGLATNPSQFFAQEKIKGSGDEYRVTVAGTKEGGKLISSFDRRTLNRDEDAYEFSSGSSRGVSLLKNKGAQSATMRALNAVRRIPRKFREGRIFGLDALSGGVIELNASEMGAAYPGSLDNTRTSALSANTLSEISNKDVDRYTKTGLNILNYQGNESSRQKYFSSFNKTLENLKKYDEIGYYKIASNLAKSGFGINTGKKTLFGGKASKFLARKGFSDGFVPNFSNPILSAMARENAAGVPMNMMKLESSPLLKSSFNPSGLAVTNRRDEPGGISQGIARAKREGINPKSYGIPNFVDSAGILRERKMRDQQEALDARITGGGNIGFSQSERNILKRRAIIRELSKGGKDVEYGEALKVYRQTQEQAKNPRSKVSKELLASLEKAIVLEESKAKIAIINANIEKKQSQEQMFRQKLALKHEQKRQDIEQKRYLQTQKFNSILAKTESSFNGIGSIFGNIENKVDKQLISQGIKNPQSLRGQRGADRQNLINSLRDRRSGRIQGAAIGASFIAPALAGGLEPLFGSNSATRGISGAIQGASSGAVLGSGFGVVGTMIGAGAGLAVGTGFSAINEPSVKQQERLERFVEKQKKQGEQFDIAAGIGSQTANIKDLISSGASPALIRKNQQDLFKLVKDVRDPRILKAVGQLQSGEYTGDQYTEKIAKIQTEREKKAGVESLKETRRSSIANSYPGKLKLLAGQNIDSIDTALDFNNLGGKSGLEERAATFVKSDLFKDISEEDLNVLSQSVSKNKGGGLEIISKFLEQKGVSGETLDQLKIDAKTINDSKAIDELSKSLVEFGLNLKFVEKSNDVAQEVAVSFGNLNRTLNESAVRANALNSVSDNRKNISNRSSIFDQRASLDLRKYGLSESQILNSESAIAAKEIALNKESALTELSRGAQGSLGSLRSGDAIGGLSTGIKDSVIKLLSSAETASDPAKIIENIKAIQDKLNSDTGNPNEGLKEQLRNILIPLSADVTKINDNAKEQLTELEESVKQQKKMIDLNKNLSRFGGREGFISGNRFDKDTFKKNLPGYFDAFSFQPNKNGELQTRDFNRNQGNVGKDAAIAQNRKKLIDSGRSTAGLIQQLSDSGAMTESFQEFINKKGNEGLKNVTVQANEQDILNQYRDIGKAGYEQTGLNQFAPELGAKINQQLGNLNSKTGYDGIIKTIESFNATSSGSKDAKKAALDLFKSLNPTVKKSKEAAEKQLGVLSPEKANIKFQGDVISNFDTMIKVAETIANNTSMLDSLREKGKNDAVIYNATKESGAITAKINETNASIASKENEKNNTIDEEKKASLQREIEKLQSNLKTLETDKKTQDGKVRAAVEVGKGIDEKIKNDSVIPTVAPSGTPVVTPAGTTGVANQPSTTSSATTPPVSGATTPMPSVSPVPARVSPTYDQMAGNTPYAQDAAQPLRFSAMTGGNGVYDQNGVLRDLNSDVVPGLNRVQSPSELTPQRMAELSGEKAYGQDILTPDKYYQMAGGGNASLSQKEQGDANALALGAGLERQAKILEEFKSIFADKSSKEAQASSVGSNASIVINMKDGASAPEVAEEIKNMLSNLQYRVANVEEQSGTKTPPLSLTSKAPSLGQ